MAPSGLYARLCHAFSSFFFFNLRQITVSQDLLDRFSRTFHQIKGICVNFLDPDLFFDSFREVAMATDFGENLHRPSFSILAFLNRLEYRNMDEQLYSAKNDPSTLFTNMANFGPVTPEIEM